MRKTNILGVHFSHIRQGEALAFVMEAINNKTTCTVFTPNPEIVMEAYHNHAYRELLNKGDLVVPDGIGIVIGSKLIKRKLPERVAGYDLVQKIFESIKETEESVYFFGAKEGVAQLAADKMMQVHPGLKIAGAHHGYTKDYTQVLNEINRTKPSIILVGLGAPRQEQFIIEHLKAFEGKILIGVGGSFDGMAGLVKRAPLVFRKAGLEWFYRLLKQPSRFKRMLRLPVFLFKMLIEGKNYK